MCLVFLVKFVVLDLNAGRAMILANGPRVLGLLTAALLLSASHAGAATLTVTGGVGDTPTGNTFVTFDGLTLGSTGGTSNGVTVTFSPDAAAVQGTTGTYAEPYLSSNQGASFGQSNGPDTTPYLTSGSTGSYANAAVTLTFPTAETYLGLLWGSVDNYNTLTFYNGLTPIGTVTSASFDAGANGDQGVNGTYYVNITLTDEAFTSVVATSTQYAFEFDDVSYNSTLSHSNLNEAPLPAAVWLFGSVLAGSGLVMRRRRKGAPVSKA
jgi:hypothetical protein